MELDGKPTPTPAPKPKKDRPILVPLDEELRSAVEDKARKRGWPLTAVIRGLLRLWVDEDLLSPEDVGNERKTAPKGGDRRSAKAPPARAKRKPKAK